MPSKSRRNRRQISQNRKGSAGSASPAQAGIPSAATAQPDLAAASYTSNVSGRSADTGASVQKYFLSDLKWIGVVTAIMIILLIASYFVFK